MIPLPVIPWKHIVDAAFSFLKVAWPVILISVLSVFVAQKFYYGPKLEKMKVELSLKEVELERARQHIKDLNDSILELSKTSAKVSEQFLDALTSRFDRMNRENRDILKNIIDAGIPESCEESRQYLLEMTNQLKWRDFENE